MKLAPATMALCLVVIGAVISAAGVLIRVPSYDSLQVVSGSVDQVNTRRQALAEPTENLLVEMSVVTATGAKLSLTFKQPEARSAILHALGGRKIVARLGPGGELYDLRVDQVTIQTYMQTAQPLIVDKAWLLLCGAMFAGIGLAALWLTRRRPLSHPGHDPVARAA